MKLKTKRIWKETFLWKICILLYCMLYASLGALLQPPIKSPILQPLAINSCSQLFNDGSDEG